MRTRPSTWPWPGAASSRSNSCATPRGWRGWRPMKRPASGIIIVRWKSCRLCSSTILSENHLKITSKNYRTSMRLPLLQDRTRRLARAGSIVLLLCLGQRGGAQLAPPDEFFHGGAQAYLSNNIPKAWEQVTNGRAIYPDD